MILGMLGLIYLGRDRAVILDHALGDIDLHPLLDAADQPTVQGWRGQVVVLHFWGTWCPPCRREYPEFAKLYEKYSRDAKVRMVSISCSPGPEDDVAALQSQTQEFLKNLGVAMPIYSDPAAFTRSYLARMLSSGGFVYPATILVDRGGTIREVWRGETSMKKVDQAIQKWSGSS
jgi:thiol-disulfide isomerase/thioredoxin